MGAVQEQGTVDAIPYHIKGSVRAFPVRRGPTRSWTACLTPACLFTNIFVLTVNICTLGSAGGCKIPRDGGGGGRGAGGRPRDVRGANIGKAGEARGMTEVTETTALVKSGRVRNTEDSPWGTEDDGERGSIAWEGHTRKRDQPPAPSGDDRRRRRRHLRRSLRPQGGWGGRNDANGDGRRIRGKRHGKRPRVCSGRHRRHLGRNPCRRGRSGSRGLPWGGKKKR